MKDEDIINLFFSRDEKAIEETGKKYGRYCMKIAGNILWDKQDVEECVDDTYLRLWKRIPPTRPRLFKTFIGKITRELAFDRYRASKSAKRDAGTMIDVLDELDDCIPNSMDVEQSVLGNELTGIIRDFVDSLDKKDAYIFTCRYFYAEDISEIAIKFGMSNHYISVRLGRIRSKLKARLEKEGYQVS